MIKIKERKPWITKTQPCLAKNVRHGSRVRSITAAKVEEGLASQLELLERDRRLLSSERAVNRLKFRQLKTCVDLFKALGGGWEGVD